MKCFTYNLVFLFLFIASGCSDNSSSKMASLSNENTLVHNQNSNVSNIVTADNENSKSFDCKNPNGYSLNVAEDSTRNIIDTVTVPKILNIVVGKKILNTIKIPTQSDANGFSLRSTEITKEGFEIKIEYGSRIYFQKQFNFICKEGNFYLYKVKVESFDKQDPESMNDWDEKEIKINPILPIEKFSIFDYLNN
jgi:hypothetical protein